VSKAWIAATWAAALVALATGQAEAGWRWYVDTDRSGVSEFNAYYGQAYDSPLPADYDGDGRADFAVVRTRYSPWRWYIDTNRNGTSNLSPSLTTTASSGTRLALDMDGDGRADLVTVKKDGDRWRWFIDTDRDGVTNVNVLFGWVDTDGTGSDRSDKLVPADYDGNGSVDIAVVRRDAGGKWHWYVDTNRNGVTNLQLFFGQVDLDGDDDDTSDIPEPADYDGDGAADPAVRRVVDGKWKWYADTDWSGVSDIHQVFGLSSDVAFPADYDGDGRTDFAVLRRDGANWKWFVDTNRNGYSDLVKNFGLVIDHPVPADYDGDGRADFAVVRPQWSENTYRLPGSAGVPVYVSRDSYGHSPDTENFDLVLSPNTYAQGVVAAADGTVVRIEDDYSEDCPQGQTGDCNSHNNYVWIAHANGEWSKYTHVEQHSVRWLAGLSEGSPVVAGQFLGIQSDVGAANGKHVHFEVGIPYNVADPINSGGWLKGYNLAPRFCNVPGNVLAQGATYTAGACGN